MADFTQIIQEINADINTNGANEITGAKLNKVLRDMISAVNSAKQDPMTIDATPTEDSTNPVQSGGVYEALQDKPTIYYTPDLYSISPTILSNLKVGDIVKFGEVYSAIAIVTLVLDGQIHLFSFRESTAEEYIYDNGGFDSAKVYDMESFSVKPSNPTTGDLAGLDSYGNLTDSGIAANEVATKSDIAYLQQQIDALKNQ